MPRPAQNELHERTLNTAFKFSETSAGGSSLGWKVHSTSWKAIHTGLPLSSPPSGRNVEVITRTPVMGVSSSLHTWGRGSPSTHGEGVIYICGGGRESSIYTNGAGEGDSLSTHTVEKEGEVGRLHTLGGQFIKTHTGGLVCLHTWWGQSVYTHWVGGGRQRCLNSK